MESARAAACAAEGGADRVELCADLSVDGLTPSAELLRSARAGCSLPMMVMIRPRAGDFRADATLLTRMELDIERALDGGADGLVFGVLDEREEVDEHALERLVTAARGRPVTFHRAFDSVPDPDVALERLVELGVTRILTSGGAPTALEGASVLARLIARAGERIAILPGGHVRSENASELLRQTGARELHSAVAKDADLTVARVARLAESMSR